jgi:hypothetical protein
MIGQNKERWRELCEQVAVEQDPKKLVELTTEIYRHLEEMRRRLHRRRLMDATPPEIFKLNPLALFVFGSFGHLTGLRLHFYRFDGYV